MYILTRIKTLTLIIILIAILVRVSNLLLVSDNPFFEDPIMDEKYHVEWAEDIASEGLLTRIPFYRAPAYPYSLGAIFAMFGKGFVVPRIYGLLLGSLSCVLIFLIGSTVFSKKVGFLAGVIMAFYPMHLYFDYMLLTVGLEITACLLSTWLLFLWFKKNNKLYLFLSGLSLGLAIITRPNFLVLIPIMLLIILLNKSTPFRKRLNQSIMYCIGLAPLIITVACVNIVFGKDFVLLAYNGGINFYFGNNPFSNGWTASSVDIHPSWWGGVRDAIMVAQRNLGRVLRPSEISNYWFGRGLQYIVSNPIQWIGLMVKKTYLFFNSFELSNNQSIYGFSRFSFLLRNPILNFGIIFALAVWGSIAAFKKKYMKFLLLTILVYAFSVIVFLITARYRMPVVPFIILIASYAIFWFIDQFKHKKFKPAVIALIICISIFAFSQTDLYGTHVVNYELIHVSIGNRYFAQQNHDRAIQEYEKAIEYNPQMWEALTALGNTYMAQHEYDKALETYNKSLSIHENVDALCKKGIIYSLRGNRGAGEQYLLRAFELDPKNPEVFYYAAMHYIYYQELRKALISFKKALEYYPDPEYSQSINYNIGKLYLSFGSKDSACKYLSMVDLTYLDTDSLINQLNK